jgi:hypothetical protein
MEVPCTDTIDVDEGESPHLNAKELNGSKAKEA